MQGNRQGLPDGWSPKFYDGLETVKVTLHGREIVLKSYETKFLIAKPGRRFFGETDVESPVKATDSELPHIRQIRGCVLRPEMR